MHKKRKNRPFLCVSVPPPENAQKAFDIVKKYDRNGDGKIAVSDIEGVLRELGVGTISPRSYSH